MNPSRNHSTETQNARILIVEDDPEVGDGLEDFFSIKGYSVSRAADGETALQEITTLPPYDVVLLDVVLPEKDGFEILREARKAGVDSPVIILTVKGQDKHKLRGFDLGADDYVTKPFNAEELAARVRAVLKRSRDEDDDGNTYSFGDITVDFTSHTAVRHPGVFYQPPRPHGKPQATPARRVGHQRRHHYAHDRPPRRQPPQEDRDRSHRPRIHRNRVRDRVQVYGVRSVGAGEAWTLWTLGTPFLNDH